MSSMLDIELAELGRVLDNDNGNDDSDDDCDDDSTDSIVVSDITVD